MESLASIMLLMQREELERRPILYSPVIKGRQTTRGHGVLDQSCDFARGIFWDAENEVTANQPGGLDAAQPTCRHHVRNL
jgi:hypothetical protein